MFCVTVSPCISSKPRGWERRKEGRTPVFPFSLSSGHINIFLYQSTDCFDSQTFVKPLLRFFFLLTWMHLFIFQCTYYIMLMLWGQAGANFLFRETVLIHWPRPDQPCHLWIYSMKVRPGGAVVLRGAGFL